MSEATIQAFETAALQFGLTGDPAGQLLIALVLIALVVVIGKFVLALAWRLISIAILIVAAWFLLTLLGVF